MAGVVQDKEQSKGTDQTIGMILSAGTTVKVNGIPCELSRAVEALTSPANVGLVLSEDGSTGCA